MFIFFPARRDKDGPLPNMIDIRDHPEVCEAINAVVNNRGIAEVKNEKRRGEDNLVVVEIARTLKTKKPQE